MSDISFQLVGLKSLQARLGEMPTVVQDHLRVFMARFGLQLRDQVRTNITERFKSGVTSSNFTLVGGRLHDSVKAEHIEQVGSVTERVYIDDVPYAAIQEYGGKTAPHVIEPVNGKALAFMAGGPLGFSSGDVSNALVFAKKVNHPGSDIPERSYARLALVQLRAPFEDGIRQTVDDALGENFAIAAE